MEDNVNQVFEQASVFQKMWTDAFSDMAQVWTRHSPEQPPPDAMRSMRSGMLKVMTKTWDDFVRTPEFLEYMKQGMDGSMDLKKMSADFMSNARHASEGPAREDIDGILLAIRHMERRLLDRIEEVDGTVAAVGRRLDVLQTKVKEAPAAPSPAATTRKAPARKAATTRKAPVKAASPKPPARKAVPRKAASRKTTRKS